MDESFEQKLAAAREALDAGDAQEAFRALRWVFFEPELAGDPERLGQAFEVFAPIAHVLVGEETAAILHAAAGSPDNPQILYDLGYELIELGLPEIAACALSRANYLAPGQEVIVTELVAALERDGRNEEACMVLRAEEDLCQASFICRYLLAFNSVMSGDLGTAGELLPTLSPPPGENEAVMTARIQSMLARAELVKGTCDLGPQDLRGWHFVTTGGLLLHRSPYGFDEGMNGRFAFIGDSPALCRLGLVRLNAVLEAWDESPPWILAPPDRDSQILAAAAEELLGLPVADYSPDAGPGLIVSYDLNRLDEGTPPEILQHTPGQILFAHACRWTDPPPCAPDVTTLLYQALQTPWGERMRVGSDGEMETVPEDTGAEEEIAQRIVEATDEENQEAEQFDPLEQVLGLARLMKAEKSGASFRQRQGRRSPFWEGGPVKSSRFV